MNFEFSDDQKQLRDQARRFLAEKCPPKAVRAVLDGPGAGNGRSTGKTRTGTAGASISAPELIRAALAKIGGR